MDQEYTFKRILRGKRIFDQVGLVGVGREAVDRGNLCPHFVFFAEDFNPFLPLRKPSTECVRGHPGGDQDGVAFILNVVAQVVQDATGLGHA